MREQDIEDVAANKFFLVSRRLLSISTTYNYNTSIHHLVVGG
jgi:hypothetical protein